MLNKFATIVLVGALICTLGIPAFPQTRNNPGAKTLSAGEQPDADTGAGRLVNEELRAEILKLVADTKAGGNVVRFPPPQIQSPQRNNLSKGAKIAIGIGIAVAVVAVIIVSKRCDNEPGAC